MGVAVLLMHVDLFEERSECHGAGSCLLQDLRLWQIHAFYMIESSMPVTLCRVGEVLRMVAILIIGVHFKDLVMKFVGGREFLPHFDVWRETSVDLGRDVPRHHLITEYEAHASCEYQDLQNTIEDADPLVFNLERSREKNWTKEPIRNLLHH